MDDGSTDSSGQVLQQYGDSIQLLTFAGNRGVLEARNHGAARAEGEYLVFLDGDDLFMPWALDVYERIITEGNPSFILGRLSWFTGAIPVPTDQDVPGRIEFVEYESLMAKDRPVGLSASSLVIHRRAFQNVGGWSPDVPHVDCVDLVTKLGYSGHVVLICSPTVSYRVHASNSILTVPPFLRVAHHILRKERAGGYSGGRGERFRRYAWLAGTIVNWIKRALRAGYYRDAARLGVSGSPMVLAGIVQRSIARIRGRRPVETLDLHLERTEKE